MHQALLVGVVLRSSAPLFQNVLPVQREAARTLCIFLRYNRKQEQRQEIVGKVVERECVSSIHASRHSQQGDDEKSSNLISDPLSQSWHKGRAIGTG